MRRTIFQFLTALVAAQETTNIVTKTYTECPSDVASNGKCS